MGTTRTALYNLVAVELKLPRVSDYTDNVAMANEITAIYDHALRYCLEQGYWDFAIVTAEEDSDSTPSVHHFSYQFTKPSDWVLTAAVSASSTFIPPLDDFADEAGSWYADVDPLYVKYVSDDSSYGGDLTVWPESYTTYVSRHLAGQVGGKLGVPESVLRDLRGDSRNNYAGGLINQALKRARSNDAMNGPAKTLPQGRLVSLRGSPRGSQQLYNRKTGLNM